MKDKKLIKYYVIIAVLFIGLIIVEANKKNPVDWTPTFINTDKNPYGTYIIFDLLKDVFPNKNIHVSRLPIFNELEYVFDDEDYVYIEDDGQEEENNDTGIDIVQESYLFINKEFGVSSSLPIFDDRVGNFGVDKLDIRNLLAFVEYGNNVFISAENITPLLLDTLGLKMKTNWASADSIFVFNDLNNKEYRFSSTTGAVYSLEKADSSKIQMAVLAESKREHKPVFVKIKRGKGYIYLHTIPVAFSNIELLNLKKYEFAFACLSHLPRENSIIWDEYQKQGRIGEYSTFRVIWNHPAMLWAYYIALATGLLFMLFRSKRMQRIIPVIEPPKNTSLEFLDTLSNLYYQKQAYESIVDKRHNYFLDLVRNRYYLNTETIDNEFMQNLSVKSGVEFDIIENIFELHKNAVRSHNSISNSLLLKYNEKLEEFYRKMK